jgi:hypothetical protein
VVTQVSVALRVLDKHLELHQIHITAEMDLLGLTETAVPAEMVQQTLAFTRGAILSVERVVVLELAPVVVTPM